MTDLPIGGVVLAGGLATRMHGRNKAMLDIGGRPLLAHIIGQATPQLRQLVISANGNRDAFTPFRLPLLADDPDLPAGPIAGIVTAMRWYRDQAPGLSHMAVFPGDSPFFPADLVARMHTIASDQQVPLVRVEQDGQPQPLFSLWSMQILPSLESAAATGMASPLRFINSQRHTLLHYDSVKDPLLFSNINTENDWLALTRAIDTPQR